MDGWKEHLASALTGTTIDVSNMFIILSTAWTDVVDIWVNAKDMVVSPVEIRNWRHVWWTRPKTSSISTHGALNIFPIE
jgi:hypothetical protein